MTLEELKKRIDLHDLAEKLGLKRPGGTGNYRSPHHPDSNPSLSIFNDGKAWKDHSADVGGSAIDLVMHVENLDSVGAAIRRLRELYCIEDEPRDDGPRRPRSRAEFIADKCFNPADLDLAIEYLTDQRGIPRPVVERAIDRRAVGFNAWTSDVRKPGEPGYGGPAVAFITRTLNPGHVVAVDMRYLDPEMNGGVKTQCQGEKTGHPWFSDINRLQRARTVYLVESPINALSVESASLKSTAALAIRGTSNASRIDWSFLLGKRVVICMDNDEPNERTGYPPGARAAWALHEALTAINIGSHLVDQGDWEHNDVNDILREAGPDELRYALQRLDPWAIPGLRGDDRQRGKSRVFLPSHDFALYWRYRVKEDFTRYIAERKESDDGGHQDKVVDLAGFRIASLSRVTIASATSTMTGEEDAQPRVLFATSVQTARHGNRLIRRVFDDEKLHNVDQWRRFGPIFNQSAFLRLVVILERTADIGARDAVNFVGLAWRNGRLVVNEGPDCYFTEPEKQCPYHGLMFPSGTVSDGRRVVDAYQKTFFQNAAAIPLVWALGAHLKVHLGFWPHMIMAADKGSGKSTLLLRLTRTLAFHLFSNESLKTAYRILTSISHTSHPVGWEEISANSQKTIDDAVSMLQQSYQYTATKRGSDMTEYLLSAPVLLAGEDVPVKSLTGKLVRTDLTGKMGPLLPEELPKFPVRQWLQFLAGLERSEVQALYRKVQEYVREQSRASGTDSGARRMEGNYAALITAWRLLCEFLDVDRVQGEFIRDAVAEMNAHIADTSGDREPWVWITETLVNEIAGKNYRLPHTWGLVEDKTTGEREECLIVRPTQVMHHLSSNMALRDVWNMLPVKSARVYKQQLMKSGVVVDGDIERSISGKREAHMVALGLSRISRFGLTASPPEHIE